MTQSDTPKNGSNEQPEEVEAEIVDEGDAQQEKVTHVESETIIEDDGVSSKNHSFSKFMTPGTLLLSAATLMLAVIFFTRGGDKALAETAQLASSSDKQQTDVFELTPVEEETAVQIEEPELRAEAKDVEQEEAAPSVADLSSPEEVSANEERRQAALERAERRASRVDQEASSESAEPIETQEPAAPAEVDLKIINEIENVVSNEMDEAEELINEAQAEGDQSMQALIDETAEILETVKGDAVNELNSQEVISTEETQNTDIVSEEKLTSNLENLKEDVRADVLAETKAEMAADKRKIERQQDEIDRLRAELEEARLEQDKRTEQLEARLNILQKRDVAAATKQAALSLAVTNLQRQMSAGRPFVDQLGVLEKLSPTTATIQDLKPFAETGLPTVSSLKANYGDAARRALAASNKKNAKGPFAQMGANLSSLFSVRKTGMVEGDSTSAIISRAEVKLGEGDIYACLRELSLLDETARLAMADWISQARSLVSADKLLDEVSNQVLTTL